MRRLIISIPAAESIDTVSAEAQAAVRAAGGQWASPMPGTQPHDGRYLADAVTQADVAPETVEALAPGWQVLGCWSDTGEAVRQLDLDALAPYLAPVPVFDLSKSPLDEGFRIGTEPAPLRIPHNFAGW